MKRLAVLGRSEEWHVQRLLEACRRQGIDAECRSFRELEGVCGRVGDYRSTSAEWDAVIVRSMPRGSLEQIIFRMDVLGCLETQGCYVCNPARSLEIAIDKYLALARLEKAGLPVPRTIVAQEAAAAMRAFDALGGDVVVKPLFGSEGRGILRVCEEEMAWRVFKTLEQLEGVLYVQEFIEHEGRDVRALVIGDRVLAMERTSAGDFRTNLSRGGEARPATISRAWEELALRASAAVGTLVAGVDLLPTADGPFLLEVNGVPGWRGIQRVTGVDVAEAIVAELLARA